jgi:hypothetical protein
MDSEMYIYAILGLLAIIILVSIVYRVRLLGLRKRHKASMHEAPDYDTQPVLRDLMDRVAAVENETKHLNEIVENIMRNADTVVSGIGVVRFRAFDDVGGDQSFSIAFLNHRGDGVVLTNLFGRTEARIYAKPICNMKSQYNLSEEEIQALEQAAQVSCGSKN